MKNQEFKICRNCHEIYKKLDQKFCGNGCERAPPYYVDGDSNPQVETREVLLTTNEKNIIRWMCISCQREYHPDEIEKLNWVCDCGIKNNFYPFTSKHCANVNCPVENTPHKLLLEAKLCDLCGKSLFLLNNTKKTDSFIQFQKSINTPLEKFEFPPIESIDVGDKQNLSLQVMVLNNNYEKQVFGKDLAISIKDLIKNAPGFIPDSIYLKYIQNYGLDTPIFTFTFDSEAQKYDFSCVFPVELIHLDAKYRPKEDMAKLEEKTAISLKENEFLLIKDNFFKLRIWVY